MIRRVFRASRRGRSPLNLLVVLGAITIGSAVSLTWLGWKLLEQDASLEAQRVRERLEHDADRAVQAIARRLGDVEEFLIEQLDSKPGPLEKPFNTGIGLVLTPEGVEPIPPARLAFHPAFPARREPPASMFAEADRLEFQLHDYQRAGEAYRKLAQTADPGTRAAALLRLARVQRAAGKSEAALTTFGEMVTLGDVPVFERPADLVARVEAARILDEMGRHAESRAAAESTFNDLSAARWLLTRGQYESIVEDVAQLAGVPAPAGPIASLSVAATDSWNAWRAGTFVRGSRLLRPSGVAVLVTLHASGDRAAAWIVEPRDLLVGLEQDPGFEVSLTDDGGTVAGRPIPSSEQPAVRASVDTHLPWTMHVRRTASVGDGGSSRALVISGLVLMLVFLGAGAFFIGRAIRQETELARLQSDFVSAVSHEFRTPLAAMRQFSELLADGRVPNDERRQHYYESLAGESRRLQRLVESILNFSRLEAGATPYHAEPTDLGTLIRDVVAEFRSQLSRPECEIEVAGSADAVSLVADRQAIALALHNLLDNAVKYSGGNQPVRVDWARHGDRIALSVRDRGPGISVREQQQIFQRFFRGEAAASANVRGTGIGLAMVKLVVASHGGDVTVESQPGAGSTFTMFLPVAGAT